MTGVTRANARRELNETHGDEDVPLVRNGGKQGSNEQPNYPELRLIYGVCSARFNVTSNVLDNASLSAFRTRTVADS